MPRSSNIDSVSTLCEEHATCNGFRLPTARAGESSRRRTTSRCADESVFQSGARLLGYGPRECMVASIKSRGWRRAGVGPQQISSKPHPSSTMGVPRRRPSYALPSWMFWLKPSRVMSTLAPALMRAMASSKNPQRHASIKTVCPFPRSWLISAPLRSNTSRAASKFFASVASQNALKSIVAPLISAFLALTASLSQPCCKHHAARSMWS
ncbi:hypothetical protein BDP81DRAFT_415024 [Colletotrichum phormii]|uniref:Uncharacterized protein n=1 Tax=Colletotrichum phormii TaxID=359342 RepID=A0AAJ0A141_9PEZI|nr:uncharacterized protein BDP81DRAFT_415024 [Colletotrichum phormii]KAK1654119.1 hypothetical protein BDP81DRAFT_415024 [Colletotrichum phormii]